MTCPDDHKHGANQNCYLHHRCRCDSCRTEHAARERNRRRMKAYGRHEGRVDPRGTQRRIQGLQILGWRAQEIGDAANGMRQEVVREILKATWVQAATRDRIRQATETLLAQGTGPSPITARRAKAKGWVPVHAYDDIDNDNAPVTTERDRELRGEELTNELEWLINGGMTAHDISRTLGKTMEALEHHAWRWGRNDLASYLREKSVA